MLKFLVLGFGIAMLLGDFWCTASTQKNENNALQPDEQLAHTKSTPAATDKTADKSSQSDLSNEKQAEPIKPFVKEPEVKPQTKNKRTSRSKKAA